MAGGSLSPRGDWRMPSDASGARWVAELESAVAGVPGSGIPARPQSPDSPGGEGGALSSPGDEGGAASPSMRASAALNPKGASL